MFTFHLRLMSIMMTIFLSRFYFARPFIVILKISLRMTIYFGNIVIQYDT